MKLGKMTSAATLYEVGHEGYYFGYERTTSTKLPAGVYTIASSMMRGTYLSPKEMSFEKVIQLPDMRTNKVMEDIAHFWKPETKKKYDEMGLIYKRGILMHGRPGTGKSATIFKIAEEFIKQDGIVVFNPDPSALYNVMKHVQNIEADRKILVIFEEFEYYLNDMNFLSLLDGELQLSNIVYIGTTNYIDKVPERIKNRPSRFAHVVEIGLPTLEDRFTYLDAKLGNTIDRTLLEQVAALTEGFVLDQVKDVVISHFVFGYTLDESIAKLKTFSWSDELEEDETEDEEEMEVAHSPSTSIFG